MDEPSISIRLFGELELRAGSARLPRLESARARSLLAFLLLHRDAPQSRQRLAFLLWPDSTEAQARTNLRHLLHTLRQASPELDRFVDVTPQTLWWRDDVPSWVDVAAFDAAQAIADSPEISPAEQLDALRAAIGLYRGDLLDGCYDEWVLDVRERFRDRYLAQLHRLAFVLAEDGEHVEAARVARELLRCDPLREDAYRLLMSVHAAAGDRAAAVRTFHECVSTLQRELGVDPSADTVDAYEAVVPRPARMVSNPHHDADDDGRGNRAPSLVGRDDEWRRLTDHWTASVAGRPYLVVISGEPGIGKTRLVEDFAAWCTHRGARVAMARSYATEGEFGYGVVTSWLRSGDVATGLRRSPAQDQALLARLLPELESTGSSGADRVDSVLLRQRLFECVTRTLVEDGRPTLLVMDDAQWSDEPSLQLLHYLLRLEPARPVLVVATVRREDLDEHHPLESLVAGLQMIDRVDEIPLARLSRVETETLARQTAGIGSEPRQAEMSGMAALYAETEGNPLFIVEAVRAGWAAADPERTAPPGRLPPKLQAVIAARLRPLSAEARELLDMAAVIGREFKAPVLDAVLGMDDIALVGALDELWRRGLIREHGLDAYDFAHGKIRDVAYEALSQSTRRHHHRVVADALVRLHVDEADAHSGEVAWHYDRGGRADDAVTWYRRAALHAQALHANLEASRLLERSIALVSAMPEKPATRRREMDLLSLLATPLAVVQGFASPQLGETQQRAVELGAQLGTEPVPSLLRSMVMSKLCRKEFEQARDAAGELHALAMRIDDHVLLVESEYLLGISAFWSGRFESAREHFEQAAGRFDPERRTESLVRFGHDPRIVCGSRLANTLWFLGHTNEARRARDHALAIAAERENPFSLGVALVFAALLAVDLGEPEEYRGYVEMMPRADENRPFAIAMDAFLGYRDVLNGDGPGGIARIRRAIEANRVDAAPGQRATHFRLLVAAHEVVDDAASGLAAIDEALAEGGTRIWEAEHRRVRAVFLARQDQPTSVVEAELDRAERAAADMGALGPLRCVVTTRGRIVSS